MKKSILTITVFLVLISCSSGFISCADKKNQTSTNTNQFRGLLCSTCNRQLGWYKKYKKDIENYLNKELKDLG